METTLPTPEFVNVRAMRRVAIPVPNVVGYFP